MSALARLARWSALLLLLVTSRAAAESPTGPVRSIPFPPDALVGIPNPRLVVESLLGFEPLKQLPEIAPVREFYDSTNFRRAKKLVAYFERELGAPWPELIDPLAGGGAILAVRAEGPLPSILLIVEGRDAAIVQKFFKLSTDIVDQELGRQEAKEKAERTKYHDSPTLHVGRQFHAAAVKSIILVSNSRTFLHAAIDRIHSEPKDAPALRTMNQAQQCLPANPLAWGWLNLEMIRKTEPGKEIFAQPRNNVFLTIAFGGWLDVARRSPFLCGAIYRQGRGYVATVRMPAGREGMPQEVAVHAPPSEAAGALPLLEPNRVVVSSSYYLDLSKFWTERAKLFNTQQAKAFEEFEKKSAPFLLGNRLGEALGTSRHPSSPDRGQQLRRLRSPGCRGCQDSPRLRSS